MCGIVGYLGFGASSRVLDELLASMRHRGPDGDGRYEEGPIRLGMRRLSIIDLAHGWQPFTSAEGAVIAFQNGEIYNYLDLKRELETAGHPFRTTCDTEVLAHGYAQWGIEGLLARLEGMFAIAILDRRTQKLHLARDRFGEKPLFYSHKDGCFGYASTLLAAASFPWVSDEIDPVALDRYLALHFVPGERTLFADVRQVLPGEHLIVRVDATAVSRERYYRVPLERPRPVSDEELSAALEAAVKSRLIADVPVGVFLSGGLDSSLVAALAARSNKAISTLSIGFDRPDLDESRHAEAMSRWIGSTHHAFLFDQKQFGTLVPQVADALDTPIGDQAMLPVFWLSREARKHVTVVLSGEGADELFAGYGYYGPFAADQGWRARLRGFIEGFGSKKPETSEATDRLLGDHPCATPSGFPLLTTRDERRSLVGEAADAIDPWEAELLRWLGSAGNDLQHASMTDTTTWLPDDLLVKLDRMTMAHSIEGRAPFLDTTVARLGVNLRVSDRMAGRESKVALRRIAGRLLPPEIQSRPKQGFVLPMRRWLHNWFATRGSAAYVEGCSFPGLDMARLGSIVDRDVAAGVFRERLLFAVIILLEWWQQFAAKRARLRAGAKDASFSDR